MKYWVVMGMLMGGMGCGKVMDRLKHRRFRCPENVLCWCTGEMRHPQELFCTYNRVSK
jgi:hypothetical protein